MEQAIEQGSAKGALLLGKESLPDQLRLQAVLHAFLAAARKALDPEAPPIESASDYRAWFAARKGK